MKDGLQRSSQIQWLLDRGTGSVAFVGGVGIFVIAAAIVVDILMRWLFNAPILGVDDLSIYILAVVVSSFFPAGLAGEKFVTIRFLGKALGPRSALWLEVFGALCTLAVFILIAWKVFYFTLDVTRTGLATIVLQLPQAPWWWIVTIIFAFCIPVQVVVLIKKILQALRGGSSGRGPAVSSPDEDNGPRTTDY
jgi:TRAP-type C4-dicarboxylate transport system permease small subunit